MAEREAESSLDAGEPRRGRVGGVGAGRGGWSKVGDAARVDALFATAAAMAAADRDGDGGGRGDKLPGPRGGHVGCIVAMDGSPLGGRRCHERLCRLGWRPIHHIVDGIERLFDQMRTASSSVDQGMDKAFTESPSKVVVVRVLRRMMVVQKLVG